MNQLVVFEDAVCARDVTASKALIFSLCADNRRTLERWVTRNLSAWGDQVHTVAKAAGFKLRFQEENGGNGHETTCCEQPFDLLVLDASGLPHPEGIEAMAKIARACCTMSAAVKLVVIASERGPEGISPEQGFANLPNVRVFYYSFGTHRIPL